MASNVSTNVDAFTLRAPLGVVAAITPFNFPVMVPCWIYPIALMCGNTVVFKPSSHTPGATQLQAELWKQAGGPDGTFNIVYGGKEAVEGDRRARGHPAIQFVGSTKVGQYVYEEGTKHGKRVGSFTSAKNAMLVLPDADMDLVADAAVAAGFGSAGERCMAQTMMVAVGDTAERLKPKILDRIAKLKVGDGMQPGTDMGPIYSSEHRESVINWIGIGEDEGAELLVDGREFKSDENPDGFYLGVSLFDHVTPDMRIYREEIFGPVFGIVYADTFDEGLKLINDHTYANGTAVFTTDGGAARRFKLEVEVPMIGVNVPIPVPAGFMSFSGAKDSAVGDLAMRGEDGIRFFTQQKMVTERWPEPGQAGAAEPGVPRQPLGRTALEPAPGVPGRLSRVQRSGPCGSRCSAPGGSASSTRGLAAEPGVDEVVVSDPSMPTRGRAPSSRRAGASRDRGRGDRRRRRRASIAASTNATGALVIGRRARRPDLRREAARVRPRGDDRPGPPGRARRRHRPARLPAPVRRRLPRGQAAARGRRARHLYLVRLIAHDHTPPPTTTSRCPAACSATRRSTTSTPCAG